MQTSMQLPALCCKCGEKPPTSRQTIKDSRSGVSVLTLLTMFIGMRVNYNESVEYDVPLCADCDGKIKRRKVVGLLVMALGIMVAIGGIAWLFISYTTLAGAPLDANYMAQYQGLLPTMIPILAGFLIAWIGKMIRKPKLASWNNRGFRFKNKAYHKAFAELNPTMAR
ncbi:MAG: hypothetical protein MUF38_16020 [Anaerolineae bacterium]|jgi:hypothetical protein|nr:hypothetical protein [Anaerolineae bacterium]